MRAETIRRAPEHRSAVRMPGDRGLSLKREQLRDGIALHRTIAPALEACAQRHGIALPAAR
jgi:LDH2 family malate/lactate/ureidoglycolate dehydrogenase